MADISKINIGGVDYTIKDAVARSSVTGALHFIGTTRSPLTDLATTTTLTPVSDGSLSKTTGFVAGDLVISFNKEFVWTGQLWSEFGSTGSLKKLAFKDNASGSSTVKFSKEGHAHPIALEHAVTQGTVSASGNYTPEGTVNITSTTISSSTENESGGFTGTTAPKKIGEGDKILTNTETVNVTIKPVGGTTTVQSITGVGKLPTSTAKSIPNVTSIGKAPAYETKSIPNVTSVGSVPSITPIELPCVGKTGDMFTATVDPTNERLTLTAGSAPTIIKVSVNNITDVGSTPTLGTAISVKGIKTEAVWPTLGTAISVNSMNSDGQLPTRQGVTVATAGEDKTFKAVNMSDWGMSGVTHPTIAETISASFSGNAKTVSVSGTTSGVAVANHTDNTGVSNSNDKVSITVQ